jgi:hypothetical protein
MMRVAAWNINAASLRVVPGRRNVLAPKRKATSYHAPVAGLHAFGREHGNGKGESTCSSVAVMR